MTLPLSHSVDARIISDFPLIQHAVFQTSYVDEAREKTTRICRPHGLYRLDREGQLDARHHTARLNRVSLHYISFGAEMKVLSGALKSFFVVQAPLSGYSEVHNGARQTTTRTGLASVVSPAEPLSMRWSGNCGKLILKIDKDTLEDHLSRVLHRSLDRPLRFELGMDLRSGFGAQWWGIVRQITSSVDRDDALLLRRPMLAAVEETVMTGLLLSQPNNYTPLLNEPDAVAPPHYVRHVVDRIEAVPGLPLTVTELATEAGTSVRALQLGFRRHLDSTPTQYLREVRLHRARDDLMVADPASSVTVTEVAYRWGFTHPGRFADAYHKRFGEHPSETLRR